MSMGLLRMFVRNTKSLSIVTWRRRRSLNLSSIVAELTEWLCTCAFLETTG
jgi:hypothetical protein